jgi:hypothetical protein
MHDMTERRRRGRPKGSTRYAQADAAVMRQVADLMIRDSKLSDTAAIKQVTGEPLNETLTRRLRGKWKPNREQHLADARARAARRMDDRARQTEQSGARQWLIDVQRLMQTDSFSKRVREFEQSGTMQWLIDAQRLMQTDSFSKQAQELQRAL